MRKFLRMVEGQQRSVVVGEVLVCPVWGREEAGAAYKCQFLIPAPVNFDVKGDIRNFM